MAEACLFDILALPADDLRRVLPKVSTRALARLASAYPRAMGPAFFDVLNQCASPLTIEFIRDEINKARTPPSYPEIRQAELELMKVIHEEHLDGAVSFAPPAIPLAR